MNEDKKLLTKDDKLSLAMKILGQIELVKAEKSDVYDVLMIISHLTFQGRQITINIKDFMMS